VSFLHHIHACNRWNPVDFRPFVVGGETLGSVRRSFAEGLVARGGTFSIRDGALHWDAAPTGFEARTRAMDALCLALERDGLISHRQGERYPVTAGHRNQARFLIDRACAPYFGVRAFGQHLNGFVRGADGLKLWVARRSASRRVYPDHLDHIVAGGLPWGIDLAANLRKECWEEASMPADLADRAQPVGAVTYCRDSDRGLKPDIIYCYDLQLPAGFTPQCNDDEVAGFALWPIGRVIETVRETDAFKLNCNLVIIDFLIRHGLIGPEEPEYLDLVQGLRAPLPGVSENPDSPV
jgi:isopentenyldiphosphate isomerase